MAFVHLLCYLIRPYPSVTHRSDDLFINAAIMQLATYEIDITIEQPSFGQQILLCYSRHKAFVTSQIEGGCTPTDYVNVKDLILTPTAVLSY